MIVFFFIRLHSFNKEEKILITKCKHYLFVKTKKKKKQPKIVRFKSPGIGFM